VLLEGQSVVPRAGLGLGPWLAGLLAGRLACLLPCFPATPVCENLAGEKKPEEGEKKSP